MSLARNPNMSYVAAGRQSQPFEKMHVRSHVHVPSAEACADSDGRTSYSAPNSIRHKRGYIGLPVNACVVFLGLVAAVVLVMYLLACSEGVRLSNHRNELITEMYAIKQEITALEADVAVVRDSAKICYQAAQRLGMVSSQSVEPIEINAPDTRPLLADFSLSAGAALASPGL